MTREKSYRVRENNLCYICNSEVSLDKFLKNGYTQDQIEFIWEALGAKVCRTEIESMSILPLNDPEGFLSTEGDEEIVQNLANRISRVIKFETTQILGKYGKCAFHVNSLK